MTEFAPLLPKDKVPERTGWPVALRRPLSPEGLAPVAAVAAMIRGLRALWANYALWAATFGGLLPLSGFLQPRAMMVALIAVAGGAAVVVWSLTGPWLCLRQTRYGLGAGRMIVAPRLLGVQRHASLRTMVSAVASARIRVQHPEVANG